MQKIEEIELLSFDLEIKRNFTQRRREHRIARERKLDMIENRKLKSSSVTIRSSGTTGSNKIHCQRWENFSWVSCDSLSNFWAIIYSSFDDTNFHLKPDVINLFQIIKISNSLENQWKTCMNLYKLCWYFATYSVTEACR